MANSEHLRILEQGVEIWNNWIKANYDVDPDLSEVDLSKINLRMAILSGTDLSRAQLMESDLSRAYLNESNLSGANLAKANLSWAELIEANLSEINLCNAYIKKANLSEAKLTNSYLSDAIITDADLSKTDLRDAKLCKTDCRRTNLSEANLARADLKKTDLRWANLVKSDLSGADLSGALIYGTARDDWKIDGIRCDYVFRDIEGKIRFPKSRDFRSCEFEELYKYLPTIEYYFEHGLTPIDAFVMDQVVRAINERHPEFDVRLDSFHSRGQPHAVFTVHHKEVSEEARRQIKREFEIRIARLEGKNEALMAVLSELSSERQNIQLLGKNIHLLTGGASLSGDTYKIQGQTGAVGPGAHVHDINFNQVWDRISSEVDLSKLAYELSQLKGNLKKKADNAEHFRAIAEVSEAESAARDGKGPKALEHLKKAGKWSFSVAENIGTTIAAEALKRAIGL